MSETSNNNIMGIVGNLFNNNIFSGNMFDFSNLGNMAGSVGSTTLLGYLSYYGISKLVSKKTDSKIVSKGAGVVGALALCGSGLLQKGFGKILRSVSGVVKNDGFKDLIDTVANWLDPEGGLSSTAKLFRDSFGIKTDSAGNAQEWNIEDVKDTARAFAKSDSFLKIADDELSMNENVHVIVGGSMDLLEAGFAKLAESDGGLSAEEFKSISSTYGTYINGLKSYASGLQSGVNEAYLVGDENRNKAEKAIDIVVGASGKEVVQSMIDTNKLYYGSISEEQWKEILDLNKDYHFITDTQWEYLEMLELENLDVYDYHMAESLSVDNNSDVLDESVENEVRDEIVSNDGYDVVDDGDLNVDYDISDSDQTLREERVALAKATLGDAVAEDDDQENFYY